MDVFDRTFTITRVLRLLAILVAVIGVLSALLAPQLERAREFAVLRATGMTSGEIGGVVSLQTGFMGAATGKAPMVIIDAMMRKLVHVAFGVLKSVQPFNPALHGA